MRLGNDHPLQAICRTLLKQNPGHIAVGLIDLDTATILIAIHDVEYFSEPYVETVMAATARMFRGPTIARIDELISLQQNRAFERHIEEIYFRTPRTHHFLCPVPETSCALILVTGIDCDRDTAWKLTRETLPIVVPLCPPPVTF